MDAPTLVAKVLLPRRRVDVLTRQRLLDQLYDMVDRKVALVSAPAGYGKTTLLVDFAHDLEHPVCWFALDESDRDPRVFLEHLILSLTHRFPTFGKHTLQALTAASDLSHGAPGVVNVLLNEMVETIPRWFVLVLDDYHRLGDAPEVGAILNRYMTNQVDQCLTIIASRQVVELPSAISLAARGEIGGLGQEALRFHAGEIQQLLAQNYGLHVPETEAAGLAAQSEGWITGILLSAHTMWRSILDGLVQAHRSDQPLYEYLAQEVYGHQPRPVQEFLTVSSTLKEMNVPLCQEVLGLGEAERFLALLENRNLFVTQLEGGWYRYHHLFQDYLQARLQHEDRARWSALHRQAAAWFETHERPEEAVYHYLMVEAFKDAARVMEAAVRDLFYAGRLETIMAWRTALPPALHKRAPRLALFQSRAADSLGRVEEALALAELAERGYGLGNDHHGLAYALLHRCRVWQEEGKYQQALDLARKALCLVEETDVPVDYEAHRILGWSSLALGQLEEGEAHLRQALTYAMEQASLYEQSAVRNNLADCLWRQGRWTEAIAVQQQAVADQRQVGNQGILAGELNDLGFYLYSTGEYERGLHLFEEALDLAHQSGHLRNKTYALISLGELTRDLGALDRAVAICEEGLSIADELGHGFLSAYGREALGLVHRCRGDYALAEASIRQALARAEQQGSAYQLGRYGASLGLVLAEAGETEAGLAELARARERLQQIGAHGELTRARFFTAWALFQAGQETEAITTLQQVLATADPPTREYLIVIEGRHALPLLEHAHAQGVGGEELTGLLDKARAFERTAQEILPRTSFMETEAEEPLRIFGFGYGRVERGGEAISPSDWEAASVRHLLFYLLTHPSQTRDQIAAAIWPDLPPSKVKATFHSAKFRLKRVLGREGTYFDGRCYQIHPDLDYWYDVEAFEQLRKKCEPRRRIEQLQQAIDLYQGDFLETCDADWCLMQRKALAQTCLAAHEELAGRLIARRQYRRAIQILRQGLDMDDLQENMVRQLMRAYALSGRRSQALEQYQRCVEALARELHTTPSAATAELHQRILAGLPLD
jgi:LuxR family maltose regulon positive regulatory protein